jgi:hypothetical protein
MKIFHNSISIPTLFFNRLKLRPSSSTLHLSTMSSEWIPTNTIEELFETALVSHDLKYIIIAYFITLYIWVIIASAWTSCSTNSWFHWSLLQLTSTYALLKAGNKWAGINAPTAGARTEKALPVGKYIVYIYIFVYVDMYTRVYKCTYI